MPLNLLIKNRLSRKEREAIPYLLKNYPQILISSGILSSPEYVKYFINSIDSSLQHNKKSYLLVVENKKNIAGMALLRFMEWDSSFFKTSIGFIEYILVDERIKAGASAIEKQLLKSSLDLSKRLGMKILYISVNSTRCSLVNILTRLRFNFVSAEMERISRREGLPYLYSKEKLNSKYRFRKYKKEDYSQIMKIAGEIAEEVDSKFSLTPYLPQKEKGNYYLENIKNCCLGLNADEMFIAVKNEVVVGFVCYRYDRIFEESLGRKLSFSVMGGISRFERRKNIGTHLLGWAYKQVFKNSEIILGRVYLHNLPMIRFTLRKGFVPLFEFIYTFCKKL